MQGAGIVCVYVLDSLATQAIKVNCAHLVRPEVHTEEDVPTEIVLNENEIILEKVEEEQMAMMSDDDSDGMDGRNAVLDLEFKMLDGGGKKKSGIFPKTEHTMVESENWR